MKKESILEKIENDYKKFLKDKKLDIVNSVRVLKSALKNAQIEKRRTLEEPEILEVIQKLVKQRRESIESFEKGGRIDLVEKEKRELEYLKSLLPPTLTEDELNRIVDETIQKVRAFTLKDMGKVMKEVMQVVRGRADGKMVNEIVKKKLGG